MPKAAVYFAVVEIADRAARADLGRRLLMQAIGRIVGQKASRYRIAAADSGRPIVVADRPDTAAEEAGIFVSLSHSGHWLAGAATELGPIGIDIELMRTGRDLTGIAEIAFGPEERRRAAREEAEGFYRIWTLREAIAKAHGTGLAMAADGHDRVNGGPDEGIWRWENAQLAHWRLPAGLALALAVFPVPGGPEIVWERFESRLA